MTGPLFSAAASGYEKGSLVIMARTSTPEYMGFKVSLGGIKVPRHHGGHELFGCVEETNHLVFEEMGSCFINGT